MSPRLSKIPLQPLTSKVQGRGNTTIPRQVRKHLGLDTGGTIVYIFKNNGDVTLRSTREMLQTASTVDEFFEDVGIPYTEWKKSGREIRKKLFQKAYPHLTKI